MLSFAPEGYTVPPPPRCVVLRGSPLEQHPFPRLQGTWVTRRMQASKARMSPCGRSAPGSACDVNGHLDKHRPAAWLFIPATLFPGQTSEYLLRPHHIERPLCCRGRGRRVFHLQTLSQPGHLGPALPSKGWHHSSPFVSCPNCPSWEIPRRPFQPAVCPGRVGSGGRRKPSSKGELHSDLRLGASATLFHRLGFHSLRFLRGTSCLRTLRLTAPSALRNNSAFPTLSWRCNRLLPRPCGQCRRHFSTHASAFGCLRCSWPSFLNVRIFVFLPTGLRRQCLCFKCKGLGSLKNSSIIIHERRSREAK